MTEPMPEAVRKVPVRTGDFIDTMTIFKDAHLDLKGRVDALDGGVVKSVKPRVRVPAGHTFTTKAYGGTYETTDGINYRLVRP